VNDGFAEVQAFLRDLFSGEDVLVGGKQWIASLPPAASRGPEVMNEKQSVLRRAPPLSEDSKTPSKSFSPGFTHVF